MSIQGKLEAIISVNDHWKLQPVKYASADLYLSLCTFTVKAKHNLLEGEGVTRVKSKINFEIGP